MQPPHSGRPDAKRRPELGANNHARKVKAPVKIKLGERSCHLASPAMAGRELGDEIIALAEACGTSIPDNTDPAELLVAIEEDTEIPVNALAAVAEILNYLCEEDRAKHQPNAISERTS